MSDRKVAKQHAELVCALGDPTCGSMQGALLPNPKPSAKPMSSITRSTLTSDATYGNAGHAFYPRNAYQWVGVATWSTADTLTWGATPNDDDNYSSIAGNVEQLRYVGGKVKINVQSADDKKKAQWVVATFSDPDLANLSVRT
jgi:hypothetical protein